jgi:hypothetical protein
MLISSSPTPTAIDHFRIRHPFLAYWITTRYFPPSLATTCSRTPRISAFFWSM